MKTKLFLLLFAIAGSFGKICTQQTTNILSDKGGWCNIGETAVDLSKDRYEMALLDSEQFGSIVLKVLHGALILNAFE